MDCPNCNSSDVDQTDKFDNTVISSVEVQHDFECGDCGCLFNIVYHPISTAIIEEPHAKN